MMILTIVCAVIPKMIFVVQNVKSAQVAALNARTLG